MKTGTPEQWEKSIGSLGGQLVSALKPVAQKLGVAAEHMYWVLVRQSIAESLSNIASLGIVSLFVMYLGYSMRSSSRKDGYSSNDRSFLLAVGWLATALGVVIMAAALGTNMAGLVNPEYGAIKTLLDAVHGGCK